MTYGLLSITKGVDLFMHDVLHPGSMCYFFGIHGDGGGGTLT